MQVLQNDAFYCVHLGAFENDQQDILSFSVKDSRGEGLVDYLQNFAFDDEAKGHMRTYLVRENSTSELVGYFSLKAGLVSFKQYGFKRFEPDHEADLHRRLKPSYDDECIFMYQML